MSAVIDSLIAIRILKLLVDPFEKWDACEMGIIDADGKLLITDYNKLSPNQRDVWTMLHRLVWRLKLMIAKLPAGKTQFASMAAAYLLVKESVMNEIEPKHLYEAFSEKINEMSEIEISQIQEEMTSVGGGGMALADKPEILNKKKKIIRRFKDFHKDVNDNC